MAISRNLKDFRQFYRIILLVLVFFPFKAVIAQQLEWKLAKSTDAIKVYKSRNESTGLIQIKASLTVQSSLSGFILFLQDTENIPNWLENASHSKVIKQISPAENLFITHFKGIWPVKSRDMVINTRYKQNDDLSIDIFVQDAADSIPKTENTIRVTVLRAHWHIQPIKDTKSIQISYQFSVNPNGNIPKWLANQMTLSSIWKTLKALQQQLPSSKWQQNQIDTIIDPPLSIMSNRGSDK